MRISMKQIAIMFYVHMQAMLRSLEKVLVYVLTFYGWFTAIPPLAPSISQSSRMTITLLAHRLGERYNNEIQSFHPNRQMGKAKSKEV